MAKAAKAKANPKAKKPKMKNNFFWGFNIKLISNQRKGEDAYFELVNKMFIDGKRQPVGADRAVTLKSQSSKEYLVNGEPHKLLYGKIIRFTLLEKVQWYNEATKEYTDPKLPSGVYPNGFESDYIFIPAIHRFFVAVNSKVTDKLVFTYLEKALLDRINSNEKVTVNKILSQDSIDRIIFATELKDLYVDVSITNDDAGDKAQQAIDKLLKVNNIGSLRAKIEPDKTGKLNSKEELIRGLIELTKDNGEAVAHIVDEGGKKGKVVTSDFPEKILVKTAETDDVVANLLGEMYNKYKNEPDANR